MRVGSYTTALVLRGRVTRMERHVARLRRDALRLGLEPPDPRAVERLFVETAEAAFPDRNGIVRVEWAADEGRAPSLATETRVYEEDERPWRAVSARVVHPGAALLHGAKGVDFEAYARARVESDAAGVDEALLFDREGWLVEGARSNLIVVDGDGRLVAPEQQLGPVEGLGLTLARERTPSLEFGLVGKTDLARARELIAVNAVRGAIAITHCDGEPIGNGIPGPWMARLGVGLGFD